MHGLKTFYQRLSSTNKDIFLQLVGEFSMSISQSLVDDIEERLDEVTKKLNKINAKRELLGDRADLFSKFSNELDVFSKKKNASLEIILLKQLFNEEEDKLRREIAESRPDDLLKEKYELKNSLRTLRDKTASFSKINHVMHLILRKKGHKASDNNKEKVDDKNSNSTTKNIDKKVEE